MISEVLSGLSEDAQGMCGDCKGRFIPGFLAVRCEDLSWDVHERGTEVPIGRDEECEFYGEDIGDLERVPTDVGRIEMLAESGCEDRSPLIPDRELIWYGEQPKASHEDVMDCAKRLGIL